MYHHFSGVQNQYQLLCGCEGKFAFLLAMIINFVPVPKNILLTLTPVVTQYMTAEQKLCSLSDTVFT